MEGREFSDAYKLEFAWNANVCSKYGWTADNPPAMERVVEGFKPTMLIGTTGQPGAFTKPMIRKMAKAVDRPAIFPFSNPTSKSEATPEDLMAWTDGRALVATGSPFDPVMVGDREVKISQGNNVYVFPGVGLGALAINARRVTDGMFTAAAHALAKEVTAADLATGALYPPLDSLRDVTAKIAACVAEAAVKEGVADAPERDIEDVIADWIWDPQYPELVAD
jgi:malate dehydrogenase (oxaloacetate-decarboxylating)